MRQRQIGEWSRMDGLVFARKTGTSQGVEAITSNIAVPRTLRIAAVVLILFVFGCHKKPTEPPLVSPPQGPIAVTPTWSPDGLQIAYYRAGYSPSGIRSTIRIIDIDSGAEKVIDSTLTLIGHMDWSPDGNWIVLESGASIFKITPHGDSLVELTSGGQHFYPNWSSDGSRIVFYVPFGDGEVGLHTMTSEGREISPLGVYGRTPDWLGSSDSIIAAFPIAEDSCNRLGIMSLSDTMPTPISECATDQLQDCAVAPAGDYVAFVDYSAPPALAVYLLSRSDGGVTRISPHYANCPAWSPDQNAVAYSYQQDGAIHVYDLTTGKTTQITPTIRPVEP